MRTVLAVSVLVLICGCTIIHPLTGEMRRNADQVLLERGYARSEVSGAIGLPDASRPGRVTVALSEGEKCRAAYGARFTVQDAIEKIADGLGLTAAAVGTGYGISELSRGGGDTSYTINQGNNSQTVIGDPTGNPANDGGNKDDHSTGE